MSMYEARQNKEKVNRTIGGGGKGIRQDEWHMDNKSIPNDFNSIKNAIQCYVKWAYIKDKIEEKDIKRVLYSGLTQDLITGSKELKLHDEKTKKLTEKGDEMAESIFRLYDTKENIRLVLANNNSLIHQVAQDADLILHEESDLVGIPHQHSEYHTDDNKRQFEIIGSKKHGRLGSNDMRIYRCMSLNEWESGTLKGHGGSFGEALYYFRKDKKANKNAVLVEFRIWGKPLNQMIGEIKSDAEGAETSGTLFGRKTERNATFGADKINKSYPVFSVNMNGAQGLLKNVAASSRVLTFTGEEPSTYRKSAVKWIGSTNNISNG